MKETVYIRMKKKKKAKGLQTVYLRDIAYVSTNTHLLDQIENTRLYTITKKDHNIVIIDSFIVIKHLNDLFPNLHFQLLGPTQTIINVNEKSHKPHILMVSFVWLLLFIGTGMTIMNFHYDVNMQEVQQKLHFLFTGEENDYPLLIQIPYSLGLGGGMLLFFNHWFKKRFNEEPSPLEIELHNYQQDLEQYIIHYENKLDDE